MRGSIGAPLVALLVSALIVSGASAANDTADAAQAVLLPVAQVQGTIVGTTGGAFRYYRFAHPGANSPVLIHLTWSPGYQSTGKAFNFNVYDSGGFVGSGARGDDAGPASTSNLAIGSPLPRDYLVQVFSYTPGITQAFTVDFTDPRAAPASVPSSTPPATAVQTPSETGNTASGIITGHATGTFSSVTLEYPGGNWPMAIGARFSPAGGVAPDLFGFSVYRKDRLIASSTEVYRAFDTSTKSATVTDVVPGTYTVQIFSYAEGVTMHYDVDVAGLGSVVTARDNATSERAITLSPRTVGARGTLAGQSGGSFAYYAFAYQGQSQPIYVSLAFKPGRNRTGQGVGVNLYSGADRVAWSNFADGQTPDDGLAYTGYSSEQAGYYVLQVFNYMPGVTAEYTVNVLGLR